MAERFSLAEFAYAHRGLWTTDGPPENSLAAYKAAADAGLGIEFDVRRAADGVPILFHDTVLDRMTAHTGATDLRTAEQLDRIRLNGTGETIPTFQNLLDMWPGDTPLLTEMKIDGETDPAVFARKVADMLNQHSGPAAAMSFSSEAVEALPDTVMRGQLVRPIAFMDEDKFAAMLAQANSMGVDYVCVWHQDAGAALDYTNANGLGLAVYTVKSTSELAQLRTIGNGQTGIGIIFEGFASKLAQP